MTLDALIVGGSHAGLSAAMALGRLRRKAVVIDDALPRNRFSSHANNLAGLDGIDPNEWRLKAISDLVRYPTIEFKADRVTKIHPENSGFRAHLESGTSLFSRKIILACGIKDILPDIPGFSELWGKGVYHCPYCHGFEVQDRTLAVLGDEAYLKHMVPMLPGLSNRVIAFSNGANVSSATRDIFQSASIRIYSEPVERLIHDGDDLSSVALTGGQVVLVDALFYGKLAPITMSSDLPNQLGCSTDEMGRLITNPMAETSVSGVFAAGDIASMQQSVAGALASGQMAGSGAVHQLLHEDFKLLTAAVP